MGRSAAMQVAFEAACAAVDRELAANLEMTSLFDTTHQAVILEIAQFERARDVLERHAPRAYPILAELYTRIPDAESAMERRGPAGSLKDADRLIVETWEGDARVAQRLLRAAAAERPLSWWRALLARVGLMRVTKRSP